MTMAACLFLMGMLCAGTGVFILVSRAFSKDLKVIAQQTTRLAQKGIADDVSGLVGNASALVGALSDLVKTISGVGVFLILAGFLFICAAYYLVIQVGYCCRRSR
jgi:hypothetical protein